MSRAAWCSQEHQGDGDRGPQEAGEGVMRWGRSQAGAVTEGGAHLPGEGAGDEA